MIVILILVFCVVDTVLLVRLNKCGKIVHVKQEYTYIPAPRKNPENWRKGSRREDYEE